MSNEKFTGFDFSLRSTSLSAATSFSAQSGFSIAMSAGWICYVLLFEAVVHTDYYRADPLDVSADGLSRIVYRKGCGLQLLMKVKRKNASLSTNVWMLTAESAIKDSEVSYAIQQGAMDALTSLELSTVPASGAVDANLLGILEHALTETLPKYLESEAVTVHEYSTIEPMKTADERAGARVINYVMSAIANGGDIETAVAERPKDLEALDIQIGYGWLSSELGPERMVERAAQWLDSGSAET